LQRIVRNVGRLRNMQLVVEEILDPPPYRPEAMCVRVAVENMLAKLRRASAHRKVRLAADLEDLQSEILDSNILSIVLETLVKNAIENTPDGGVVTVAVRPVQEGILFQVRDTGVGIPLGDQAFIFQGFHHTQRSEDYSSKRPFEFNAGGKGLELLRLKVLSKLGYFDISFESTRCISLPTRENLCSGEIAACSHASEVQRCPENGGTTFSVLFHERELREKYVRQKGPISDSQS
jgi:two-component system phosphate regulon sensor histidine kinase PhoR